MSERTLRFVRPGTFLLFALVGIPVFGQGDVCAPHSGQESIPDQIRFTTPGVLMPQQFIDAIDDWADTCGATDDFPQLSRTGSGQTVEIRQFLATDLDATTCAVAERANNVIYIWYHRNDDGSRGSLV